MYIAMRACRHGQTSLVMAVCWVLLAPAARADEAALARSRQADRLCAMGLSSAEHRDFATAALYFSKAAEFEPDAARSRSHRIRAASATAACPQLLQLLQLPFKPSSVMSSHDGRTLLAVGDSNVALVDARNRMLNVLISRHFHDLYDAVLSPSGNHVAVSLRLPSATVLLDRQFNEVTEVPGMISRGSFEASVFSPDEKMIATEWEGQAVLWSTADGREVIRSKIDFEVYSLAFTPQHDRLIIVGSSNTCWNYAENRYDACEDGPRNSRFPYSQWTPDRKYQICDTTDGWMLKQNPWSTSRYRHRYVALQIPWRLISPLGQQALGFTENELSLYGLGWGEDYPATLRCRLNFPTGLVSACFCCEASAVAAIAADGQITLWDTTFNQSLEGFLPGSHTIDGRYAVGIASVGETGGLQAEEKVITGDVTCVSPQGTHCVWMSQSKVPVLKSLPKLAQIAVFTQDDDVRTASFDITGRYVLIGIGDRCSLNNKKNSASIYRSRNGELVGSVDHPRPVTDVTITPDGRYTCISGGGIAAVWELQTDPIQVEQYGTVDREAVIAFFGSDSKSWFVAYADGTVQKRTFADQRNVGEAKLSPSDRVHAAVISPDGRYLGIAQKQRDNRVKISVIDSSSMECQITFKGMSTEEPRLSFSADGEFLQDGTTVYEWREGRPLGPFVDRQQFVLASKSGIDLPFQNGGRVDCRWRIRLPVDSTETVTEFAEAIAGAICNDQGGIGAVTYEDRSAALTRVRQTLTNGAKCRGMVPDQLNLAAWHEGPRVFDRIYIADNYRGIYHARQLSRHRDLADEEATGLFNALAVERLWREIDELVPTFVNGHTHLLPETYVRLLCRQAEARMEVGKLEESGLSYAEALKRLDNSSLDSEVAASWRQCVLHMQGLVAMCQLDFSKAANAFERAATLTSTADHVRFPWPQKIDVTNPTSGQLSELMKTLLTPHTTDLAHNETARAQQGDLFPDSRELAESNLKDELFRTHLLLAGAPGNPSLRFEQAKLFWLLNANDLAKFGLERLLKQDPEYADGWYLLGLIHQKAKEIEPAITALTRAAEPGNVMSNSRLHALKVLSDLHLGQGDLSAAIAVLTVLVDLDPHEFDHLLKLAVLEGEKGHLSSRDLLVDRMRRKHPENPIAIWGTAFLNQQSARIEVAKKIERWLQVYSLPEGSEFSWPVFIYGYLALSEPQFVPNPTLVKAIREERDITNWQFQVGKAMLLASIKDPKAGVPLLMDLMKTSEPAELEASAEEPIYDHPKIEEFAKATVTKTVLAILQHLLGQHEKAAEMLANARKDRQKLALLAFWRVPGRDAEPSEPSGELATDLLQAEVECDRLLELATTILSKRSNR